MQLTCSQHLISSWQLHMLRNNYSFQNHYHHLFCFSWWHCSPVGCLSLQISQTRLCVKIRALLSSENKICFFLNRFLLVFRAAISIMALLRQLANIYYSFGLFFCGSEICLQLLSSIWCFIFIYIFLSGSLANVASSSTKWIISGKSGSLKCLRLIFMTFLFF